jgi:hypothetical protein
VPSGASAVTEGNVPPGLLNAPDGWNAEQIGQFQEWFDSILAGGDQALVYGTAGAVPLATSPAADQPNEPYDLRAR